MWFNQIALGGIVRVASIVNFLDCYSIQLRYDTTQKIIKIRFLYTLITPVSKFSEQQKYTSTVLKEKKRHFLKKYDDHRKPQKIVHAK